MPQPIIDISQTIPLWPKNVAEAKEIQQKLRHNVIIRNEFRALKLVAGVDCSYDIKKNLSYAIIVLMELPNFKIIHIARSDLPVEFPYVPGFLSFREIPVILKAFSQLPQQPDFFMVDGQGIAHPRRLGIAAHLGLLTNIPAIGVAKSRLCGTYKEPGNLKGAHEPLYDKGEIIGNVLRSKEKTKVLFISSGHKFSQQTALEVVMGCFTKYRLPEPTRIADKISKQKDNMALLI